MEISVRVSPGELLDKVSILEIKREKIGDPEKLANVEAEIRALKGPYDAVVGADARLVDLYRALVEVNSQLWEIEDDIRVCEARKDFGDAFIGLARAVYRTNDKRAAIKKEINLLLNSDLVEEKSYEEY
ncbi:MAG: DUF6165 family protein [Marivibrio sp.]|uniref:DUF6165 family protein n=1 Tax=Marivibrio sp. TaxID=2039719 RepID=UPI0032EC349F